MLPFYIHVNTASQKFFINKFITSSFQVQGWIVANGRIMLCFCNPRPEHFCFCIHLIALLCSIHCFVVVPKKPLVVSSLSIPETYPSKAVLLKIEGFFLFFSRHLPLVSLHLPSWVFTGLFILSETSVSLGFLILASLCCLLVWLFSIYICFLCW